MNKLIFEQKLIIPAIGGESGVVSAGVIDNLLSSSQVDALSANQGRVLRLMYESLRDRVAPVLDDNGKVIETVSEYLLRIPMSLRFVGLTVVLKGGYRYEFKNGIQDSDFVKLEMPAVGGGGESSVKVIDNLTSTSRVDALSANMGRELQNSKASNDDLSRHVGDKNNPHGVTTEQIGAAESVHTHIIDDISNLQSSLDSKLNKTIWDSIFELVDGGIRVKGNLLANGDVVAYTRTGIEGGGGSGGGLISKVYSESELAKEILVESLTETFSAKAIKSIYDRAVTNTQNITNHESNRENPHGVTYQQVGAAAAYHTHTISNVEGLQSALDNKANSSDLSSHVIDKNNPHGVTATQVGAPTLSEYNSHKGNTSNPHNVTKSQVGLGNVDNTSDLNKPISNATQSALDKKLDKSIWDGIFELVEGGIKVKGNLLANGDLVAFSKTGIDSGGSGSGGLITRVYGLANLGTDVGSESLTETFSAKAIQDIYNRSVSVTTDLLNHKGDRSNPHGVTHTQVGALGRSETAVDSFKLGGKLASDYYNIQTANNSGIDWNARNLYIGNGTSGGSVHITHHKTAYNATGLFWNLRNYQYGGFIGMMTKTATEAERILLGFTDSANNPVWATHMGISILPNGYVGIGTGNPSKQLEVWNASTASIQVTNPKGTIRNTVDSAGNAILVGSADLYFQTANTDRMIIKAGGNIGIGTISPTEKLQVSGNISASIFKSLGNDSGIILGADKGGGATIKYNSDGNLHLIPRSGYNSVFTNGFVKVNEHIQCDTYRDTTGAYLMGIDTTTKIMGVGSQAGGAVNVIKFDTNGAERMRIQSDGRIGVNRSSGISATFDVNGSIRANGGIWSENPDGITVQGRYLEIAKYKGSLPTYPNDYYPTLKTDFTSLYFSTSNKYTGWIYNSTDGSNVEIGFNARGSSAIRFSNCENSFSNIHGGNFGIGLKDGISAKIHVIGDSSSWSGIFKGSTVGGSSFGVYIEAGSNVNDTSFNVASYNGSSYFKIRGDGKIGVNQTTDIAAQLDVNGSIRGRGNVWAQNPKGINSQGTFIELGKYKGCLPNYPNDYYPVLRTDYDTIYFSANGKFSGGIQSSNTESWYYTVDPVTNQVSTRIAGASNSYVNLKGGSFGIGTTVPRKTLDVGGHDGAAIIGVTTSAGNTGKSYKLRLGLGTTEHSGSQYWCFGIDDNVTSAGHSKLRIGYTLNDTLLTLDAGWFVGVRTTNPTTTFDVNGTSRLRGGAKFDFIHIECDQNMNSTGMGAEINCYGATMYLQHRTGHNLGMCMSGGSVVIGNATAPTAGYKLDVVGNQLVRGNMIATGEVVAYSTSDKRFKKDVKKLENCTDFVDKLNPVSYYWNRRAKKLMPHKSNNIDFGLIAQELEEVCPELVHTIFDKYKSIDYVKLIPFLIGSIQELNQKIKDLCQCQTES